MTKKIVSLLLILTMLVTLSPAVAADDSSATPTVEEILNRYHEKTFEAEIAEERDGASTYSRRSGTEKTPEEEAVDELTAAGYEAYNVVAENYDTLENALNTDFAALGLNPEYSYVIVVCGDDHNGTPSSPQSRVVDLPNYDYEDENAGTSFYHSYNGFTMLLRKIIVASSNDPNLRQSSNHDLLESSDVAKIRAAVNTAIYTLLDNLTYDILGTLLSFHNIDLTNIRVTQENTFVFFAATTWDREYMQVYEPATQTWGYWCCIESVTTRTYTTGFFYDSAIGDYVADTSDVIKRTYKSEHFNDSTWFRNTAIDAWSRNSPVYELVGDIDYYFGYVLITTHHSNAAP